MTAQKRENALSVALATLLGSKARAAILRLFLADPTRAYYQRQIEAATGLPIRAVQRELERLQSIEFLYRHTEGNRTYYQVDMLFPLFQELRALVLKAASPLDRLRGAVAVNPSVLIALLDEDANEVLLVTTGSEAPPIPPMEPYAIETMSREAFARELADRSARIDSLLTRSVDLLGRREDVVWRRIEAAGYSIQKGKGVA
ncbi:MAG: hypothetical protein KJ060_11725 [Candidatus Hydrogenedentes bacterium]|nr:hypothetical protein [Candidatus Hydrogenedentota bacterium]